jgi:hypothetical protein
VPDRPVKQCQIMAYGYAYYCVRDSSGARLFAGHMAAPRSTVDAALGRFRCGKGGWPLVEVSPTVMNLRVCLMPEYKCYEFFDDVSDLGGPGHVACSASNLWCIVSADG